MHHNRVRFKVNRTKVEYGKILYVKVFLLNNNLPKIRDELPKFSLSQFHMDLHNQGQVRRAFQNKKTPNTSIISLGCVTSNEFRVNVKKDQ